MLANVYVCAFVCICGFELAYVSTQTYKNITFARAQL